MVDANVRLGVAVRGSVAEYHLGELFSREPAIERFEPDMIFVSAGFDAHVADDMSMVSLTDADYRWVAEQIVAVASGSASGRIVSSLEGGYETNSLARCVEAHIRVLMGM